MMPPGESKPGVLLPDGLVVKRNLDPQGVEVGWQEVFHRAQKAVRAADSRIQRSKGQIRGHRNPRWRLGSLDASQHAGRSHPPIHSQPVRGQASVQIIAHVTVVVAPVGATDCSQSMEIEIGVAAEEWSRSNVQVANRMPREITARRWASLGRKPTLRLRWSGWMPMMWDTCLRWVRALGLGLSSSIARNPNTYPISLPKGRFAEHTADSAVAHRFSPAAEHQDSVCAAEQGASAASLTEKHAWPWAREVGLDIGLRTAKGCNQHVETDRIVMRFSPHISTGPSPMGKVT